MKLIKNVKDVIKRMQTHFGGPLSRSRSMVIRHLEEISKECKDHKDPNKVDEAAIKILEEELADTIIRIMSFAEHHQLRVASAIEAKIKFNETRPYKHGGKKF